MTARPSVSVIIPAQDEAANLTLVLPPLPAEYEIVLVDGQSVDGTTAVARSLRPDVVIVQQSRSGKGNALACGFRAATGDVVVTFDGDHSVDGAEIPRLVQALVDGADLAQGSRHLVGGCRGGDTTPLGQLADRGAAAVLTTAFGARVTDPGYGFRAFWRDLLPVLDLPDADAPTPPSGPLWTDGPEIDAAIGRRFLAAGARVVEVPSRERPRAFSGISARPRAGRFAGLRAILTEQRRARLSPPAPRPHRAPPATAGRAVGHRR